MRLEPALRPALLLLVLAAPAAAQEPPPATIPGEPPSPAEAPSPDLEPPSDPVTLPVTGLVIEGDLIDPRERLEAYARSIAPIGSPFVESGPADEVGIPLGTVPRLRAAFDAIGYHAVLQARKGSGGLRLEVHLRPYDRVRWILVGGNWPFREDEIQRQITLRPGATLPLAPPDRDGALDRERQRIVEYLRREGYLDANVRIYVLSPARPEEEKHLGALRRTLRRTVGRLLPLPPNSVDLFVHVTLGQPYPIGDIKTGGNRAIPSSEIIDQCRHDRFVDRLLRPIDTMGWTQPLPVSLQRLRQDLDAIVGRYREEGYPAARVASDYDPVRSADARRKRVSFSVNVTERKRVAVDFEGNRRRSSAELRKAVTIFERGAYDDYELEASADALHRFYQERGHLLARVRWRRERLSPEADRVVFTVDEGPELRVRSVEFTGNQALDSDELAGVVTVRTFPLLGYVGLGTGGYVTARQVSLDAERLVEHYRAKGFPDARARGSAAFTADGIDLPGLLAAASETVGRDARGVHVRFEIEEGPQVMVDQVWIVPTPGTSLPLDPHQMRRWLRLLPGEPLEPRLIAEDQRRLSRLLGDAGHIAARVEPDVQRIGNRVAVVWKVTPGPLTRLGPVFIRGNFLTRESTVLEQIPLAPGAPFTTSGRERGLRNLGLLQLFNSLEMTFPDQGEGREETPLIVRVEERHDHLGIPHFGLGASTDQAPPGSTIGLGLFFSVGYEHPNLLGRGWILGANVDVGNSLIRATGSFLNRRFLGTLFRLELGASYLSQETARLGNITSGGLSIGLAREMAPGVDAAVRYNVRNTTRTEPLLRGAGPDSELGSIQLGTFVGSVGLGVEWVRFDNRFVPTRGFRLSAGVELAAPPLSFEIGNDAFLKANLGSIIVVPLMPRLSFRHGLRYDHGVPFEGPLLPKVERFFAGGDTTIRGFEVDRARSEIIRTPVGPDIGQLQIRPLGGNLRVLQNIEVQLAIAGPLYVGPFMDNGVVADSLDQLVPARFRHGAGVAAGVRLPFGDLAFAWGWPLDPGPGDSRLGRFHVNIGLMY